MAFQNFSNDELVIDTKRAVKVERQATLAVLERLREIHARSIHLHMAYSSLHEFCVKELLMSDGAAHRRVNAMQLCTDLPRVKEAIANGSLSLTTAAIVQNHFKSKENTCSTPEQKEALLERVKGKSKNECDRILKPEQKGTMLHFLADDETMQLLKRLSEVTAIGAKNTAALIKRAATIALRTVDPMGKRSGAEAKSEAEKSASKSASNHTPNQASPEKLVAAQSNIQPSAATTPLQAAQKTRSSAPKTSLPTPMAVSLTSKTASPTPKTSPSRYIAVNVERSVWQRDGGQCVYVDPLSKRRCTSRFGLQLDHIMPLACGGPPTLENLRLLCRGHNRLAAERVYGKEKMAQFRRH